jgi:hypothetical protein
VSKSAKVVLVPVAPNNPPAGAAPLRAWRAYGTRRIVACRSGGLDWLTALTASIERKRTFARLANHWRGKSLSDERRGLAYHEAGHAVVAWALQCAVIEIDLVKRHVQATYPQHRLPFRDQAAICCAGTMAEDMFDALYHDRSGWGDLASLGRLLEGLEPAADKSIRTTAKQRAKELLEENRVFVDRVASHLMLNDTVDEGAFVKVILGDR